MSECLTSDRIRKRPVLCLFAYDLSQKQQANSTDHQKRVEHELSKLRALFIK